MPCMHLNTNSGNFITMAEWNKGFWGNVMEKYVYSSGPHAVFKLKLLNNKEEITI